MLNQIVAKFNTTLFQQKLQIINLLLTPEYEYVKILIHDIIQLL